MDRYGAGFSCCSVYFQVQYISRPCDISAPPLVMWHWASYPISQFIAFLVYKVEISILIILTPNKNSILNALHTLTHCILVIMLWGGYHFSENLMLRNSSTLPKATSPPHGRGKIHPHRACTANHRSHKLSLLMLWFNNNSYLIRIKCINRCKC